jgi:hypothetical protein
MLFKFRFRSFFVSLVCVTMTLTILSVQASALAIRKSPKNPVAGLSHVQQDSGSSSLYGIEASLCSLTFSFSLWTISSASCPAGPGVVVRAPAVFLHRRGPRVQRSGLPAAISSSSLSARRCASQLAWWPRAQPRRKYAAATWRRRAPRRSGPTQCS